MSARTPVKAPHDPILIAAARKAVERHGYGGLTLERIAVEADLSRVTLHRRGYSKDEIFRALVTQMFEEHRDALWPALVDGGNGAERLNLAVATVCDLCERDLMVLLAVRAQLDTEIHAEGIAPPRPSRLVAEPLQVLARDGIADGSLRDGDPEIFAALIANWAGSTYVNLRTSFGWKQRRPRSVVQDQVAAAFARS
ncbi:MAG TPA: TetR/AcrR family transcriptional regulator [Solirubrobacterales bacterium]|nr:TetR/AcrR family transcriptional regulator [Solirubrobacterales bacterium]